MTLYSLLALVPSFLMGFFIVSLCFPARAKDHLILRLFMSANLGIGISSCLYFLWCLIFNPVDKNYFVVESLAAVLLGGALMIWYHRRREMVSVRGVKSASSLRTLWAVLILVVSVLLGFALWSFYNYVTANPHGAYDAWTIWNMHARIFFRGQADWRTLFTPNLYHADYPLMIPTTVARIWALWGVESSRTPMVVAGVFMLAVVGVLFSGINLLRGRAQALIATIVLLGTPWFILTASFIYADVPLASYILTASLLFYLFMQNPDRPGLMVLCGLSAGFAAWTKNEGMMFLVVLSAAYFLFLASARPPWKRFALQVLPFAMGLILPIVSLVLFKSSVVPVVNDLFEGQSVASVLQRISNPARYWLIMSNFIYWIGDSWQIPMLAGLAVYAAAFGLNLNKPERPARRALALILVGMLLGYFVIYLIAPWNPEIHMRTSASRVLLHIFPTVLLLVFLAIQPLDDALKIPRVAREEDSSPASR